MASKCISIESVEEPNNCLLPLSRSSQDDVSSVSVKIEKTETFLLDEEKYKPETPRDTQHNESLGCSLDQISLYNVIKVESEIDSSSTTIQTNSRKKNGFLITKRKHCGTKRTKKKAERLINPSGDGKIKKKLKSINNKVTEPCTENVTSEDMPSQINDTPTSVKPQREDKSVDMPILNSEPDICETPILIEPKREVVTGSTGVELIPIKQCDVDISLDISRSSPSRQGGSPDDNKNSQDILGKIESHKSNIAASSGEQMCVGARQPRPRTGADAFGGKDIHKENRKMQKTLRNKFGIQCNGGQYRSNGGQYRSNGGQYRSNGGQYRSNGGQYRSNGGQYRSNGGQYRSNGGQYRSNGGQYRSNGGQYRSNGGQYRSNGGQYLATEGSI
ncbi:uncharacterized protein LOC121869938 [Homarus americanus]|uniref:uncharacterized protein LOC121869938 n=1 Tax=Homarus americanus TaxID=6706 RepID=UPI001C495021|nr:uncharacterized protein LOC121869938 [Homarus americanus]